MPGGSLVMRTPFVRFIAMAAAVVLIPTCVMAQGVALSVENRTQRTVTGLNAFPVSDAGHIIEDNIGGHYDPVPPGRSAVFTLSGNCGQTLVLIGFDRGSERRAQFNSCDVRTMILRD